MGKKLLFLAVALSMVLGLVSSALVAPVQPSQHVEAADLLNDNPISVSYNFSSPVISNAPSWIGEGYVSVTMDGLPQWSEAGLPVLPFRTAEILLPQGTEVTGVTVTGGEKVALTGQYLVEPGQEPITPDYEGTIEPTAANASVYGSTEAYPDSLYSNIISQSKAGYQVLLVNLHPVEYIPQTGQISYYSDITITVTLKSNLEPESDIQGLRGTASDKESIETFVDNPAIADSYTAIFNPAQNSLLAPGNYDYVIITNDNLAAAPGPYNFQVLRDSKIAQGMTATIVTTEWIYANYNGTRPNGSTDNQTKIRNFIIDAYHNWDTQYVLLGGDGDGANVGGDTGNAIIPHRGFSCYNDNDIPADMYYACLDGTFDYDADGLYGETGDGPGGGEVDLFAEVYVGRAPVDSYTEVSNFVSKTLDYTNTPANDENLRTVWMVGERLNTQPTWGGSYKDEIKNGSSNNGYTTVGFANSNYSSACDVSTLYDRDYAGNSWPKSEIISIINNNAHLINHMGHANVNYVMKMVNSDVDALTNDELYFIGYSQGCYDGAFDNRNTGGTYGTEDCIAEHLTTEAHGAVAFIGNSRYGWYMPGSTNGPSQYYDREFWDAILGENILAIGQANQDSKEDNAGRVGGVINRWCYYEITLFGDPALNVKFYSQTEPTTLTTSSTTGGIITDPGSGSFTYDAGTVVNLSAVPTSCGYQFVNWTGSGVDAGKVSNPSSSTTTITMDGDYDVQANFIFDATERWVVENSGIETFLSAVWSPAPGNTFAVGDSGTILHYDGFSWSQMTSNTDQLLVDIQGSSPSDIFAVGGTGAILHYDGTSWTPMTSNVTGTLLGVWVLSPNDVFAVGDSAIIHYDGSAWTTMSSDPILLTDVWGSASNDVFAVGPASDGFFGTGNVILHYDGTSWSPMNSNSDQPLWDLWGSASNDVFAIGEQGTIVHYNGVSWTPMTSNTQDMMFGIWGFASNNVYAVGGSEGGETGRLYHYDGAAWSEVCDHQQTVLLSDVGGASPYDMFAICIDGTILHYNQQVTLSVSTMSGGTVSSPGIGVFTYDYGTVVNLIATPDENYRFTGWSGDTGTIADAGSPNTTIKMNGNYAIQANFEPITSTLTTICTTGGKIINPGCGSFTYEKGAVVELNAIPTSCGYEFSNWSGDIETIADPNSATTTITMTGDKTVQANFTFTATAKWVVENSIPNFLSAVWSPAPGNAFAVGENGVILHYDGYSWTQMTSNTEQLLVDIQGISPSDVFAVGGSGAIVHYDGSSWITMDSGISDMLLGVWARASNDVFAVGDHGTIIHYDGSSWTPMTSNVSFTLVDVWGIASNDVFAVGLAENGFFEGGNVILHYDGTSWQPMVSNTDAELWDLWGSASNNVFAIGNGGTILHYDGSSWTPMTSNTNDQLFGIWGFSPDNVYAVGGNDFNNMEVGHIYHYDGSAWSQICDFEEVQFLTDIGGSSPYDMFAISADGNVLHYNQPVTLTVTTSDSGTVSSPGLGVFTYDYGTVFNLIATPNEHYRFTGWTGDTGTIADAGSPDTAITMNGNYAIQANFEPVMHTLTILSTVGGTVIDPGIGEFSYQEGMVVNLIAMPSFCGYEFSGWTGDTGTIADPDSPTTTITMNSDYTITANFTFTATNAWKPESSGTTDFLSGVWSPAPGNTFVVGSSGTILHYYGSSWTPMASDTSYFLIDIWGSSASDIFTVGDQGTILHYNGSAWSPMASDSSNMLLGVWARASNDVFAVGSGGTILHYDGSDWSQMASNTEALITDVWGSAANNVFAIGSGDNAFMGEGNTILHYDGTSWTPMNAGTDMALIDMWGSASNDIFAVGEQGTIVHYNGVSWSTMTSNTNDQLFGIWGFASNDVYASGGSESGETGRLYHYDGTTWSEVCDHYQTALLSDVGGASPYDMFAIGIDGTILHFSEQRTLSTSTSAGSTITAPGIGSFTYTRGTSVPLVATPSACYHFVNWTGTGVTAGKVANASSPTTTITMDDNYTVQANFAPPAWSKMTSGTTAQLNSVWGSSPTNVFAVGASGTIRRYNGTSWSAMTSGTTNQLKGVWGTSSSNVIAVGALGTIKRYNGTSWSSMTSGTALQLNSVWGSASNNVFAVGASGTIRRYNGTSWSGMTSGTVNTLNDVWGSSSSNVFAVGALGTIRKYNGTSWSGMTSGTTAQLNSVWGSSATNVFAVGNGGVIRRYNGTSWSAMTSGTTQNLWAVWGNSATDVFASGANGTILHYNGTSWSPLSSGVTAILYGTWGTACDQFFAVGASGNIVQYK